jgi:arginase
MGIRLISVPYHLGQRGKGAGQGVLQLVGTMREEWDTVTISDVAVKPTTDDEMARIQQVNVAVRDMVAKAAEAYEIPVVVASDCTTALGILAGINHPTLAAIWFDAHGDFNTPETTPSGYIDGMALAIAAGRCHQDWRAQCGGYTLGEHRVLLTGIRDLDPGEREALNNSPLVTLPAEGYTLDGLDAALSRLSSDTVDVYVHIDLDVLDPHAMPGTAFRVNGGLTIDLLEDSLRLIAQRYRITAIQIGNYDPAYDDAAESSLNVGKRLLTMLSELFAE